MNMVYLQQKYVKGRTKPPNTEHQLQDKLRDEVIRYLLEDPKRNIKSFFKGNIANYNNFMKKYHTKGIYKEEKEILAKKQQAKIKQVEEDLKKQGEAEAFDTAKLFKIAIETLMTTIAYIKDKPFNYRFTSDAVKSQIEIMRFLLYLKKNAMVPDTDENASYNIMIKRIDQLLELNAR